MMVEGLRGEHRLKNWNRLFLGLSMLMAFAACGYQLKDRGLSAPERIQAIAVPVLDNRTAETGLESIFANDLAYEFTRSKVLRLVEKEYADAVLTGTIKAIKDKTISYTAEHDSAERRVTVDLSFTLMHRDGKILWSDAAISDQEAYRVADLKQITEAARRAALKILSKRVAERVHNQVFEDF